MSDHEQRRTTGSRSPAREAAATRRSRRASCRACWRTCPDDVDVVALSGTSGGAICAALAWDGLVRSDPSWAIAKLQEFWEAMSASEPLDQLANQALMSIMSLRDLMVLPEVSPYHLPTWGEDRFRAMLDEYFDFEELRRLARGPARRSSRSARSRC